MELITRSCIAAYIRRHPESEPAFLMWLHDLKERTGRIEKSDPRHFARTSRGVWSLGQGDYHVKLHCHALLEFAYIEWLGSDEEYKEYLRAELDRVREIYPDVIVETITKEVILTPPPPIDSSLSKGRTLDCKNEVRTMLHIQPEAAVIWDAEKPPVQETHVSSLTTEAEYQQALNRLILIFDSEPDSPEFKELSMLYRDIKAWEDMNIQLPALSIADAVKRRMQILELTSDNLASLMGNGEDLDRFLAGEGTLSEKTLNEVCNFLCLRLHK